MTKPVKTERRSRRTHKNSKDGCPNCRSNRIKCTEELPVCLNCAKKGARCGYLDFSAEKIEHIRRKHALAPLATTATYELPGTVPQYAEQTPPVAYEAYLGYKPEFYSPSFDSGIYPKPGICHSVGYYQQAPHQVQKPLHRRERPAPLVFRPTRVSSDMRSQVYSRVFSHVASEHLDQENPLELLNAHPNAWNPSATPVFSGFGHDTHTVHADGRVQQLPDYSPQTQEHLPENYPTDQQYFDVESIQNLPGKKVHQNLPGKNSLQEKSLHDESMLPSSIKIRKSFRRLKVPADLKIHFTPNQFLRKRSSLYAHPDEDNPVIGPIYFERDSRQYWLEVFLKATRFDLFFLYFIDKSLNILMRASEAVVSGDIITTPPEDTSVDSYEGNFFSFFYNYHDLEALTQKSYVTYGKVILELRKSIFCFSAEYPAKMSLFSARACYMNPSTNFRTCSLMMSGTLHLFKNILVNAQTQKHAEQNIRQEILMLVYFSNMAVCPDYNYEVIRDLKASFGKYKSYVDNLAAMSNRGDQLEEGVEAALKDSLFMHNCHELDKFLTKIDTYYFPMIEQCNLHFKEMGKDLEPGVRYVSPTLIFDMMYEWFKVYPGERMLMGTKMHPLKKIIYLFFHALGKSLNHVLTPIKAVLFVDPCNITFTKVGMQFFKLDGWVASTELMPVIASIYKTIRYFECRLMLYAYYMDDNTVLDREYLRSVAMYAPESWKYRDIVRLCPSKIQGEVQLTSFSSGYFRIENFAFLRPLLSHRKCAELITQELERQKFALANEPYVFDFDLGLSNHDFNPELIIDCYVRSRDEPLKLRGHLPVESARVRVETLIQAHYEIDAAGKYHN